MALIDDIRRGLHRLLPPRSSHNLSPAERAGSEEQGSAQSNSRKLPELIPSAIGPGYGFSPGADEESLASLNPDELCAWENRDIPTVDRLSDRVETVADEKQDDFTSLNFPLHWTSAKLSWDYLFDFSVACDLLSPRPDDLVLDFAAGTCWATELLHRLGVRTVSIDLSVEMLRRGRQRLASDSRLVFRSEARFVAARGQSLPFVDESFDGVLCLNALHHLPSFVIGLKEIYRTLKPGGKAVFSEPGSAHAREPLSQFRMREEGIVEKGVSLPLIRRLALNVGFSRMRVVPLRSSAAYVFDYMASTPDRALLREMWDQTLRLSPREHARFVLDKGDAPEPTTHLPAHELNGRLSAQLTLESATEIVRAGEPFTDRLRIANTGNVTWTAQGRRFGGQVTLGLKVCDSHGGVLREDLGRTSLPHDVSPGEVIGVAMTVSGLPTPGRYRLRYDMVVEGVTWFEFQGSPCAWRWLDVT
jgi:SAM-dependent methyltransferase